ncbi:hypothetical protein C8F01DRAFT_1263627 [Mycena amicta]|nr:hypothetical protein C8F01DRAFT_1263627 [Mycena amicta]
MGRLSSKKLEKLQAGTLGDGGIEHLRRRTHANSKPIRTTGTVFLAQNGLASSYFPPRATRKSPLKTRAPRQQHPPRFQTFFSLNEDVPGSGSRKRAAQYNNWLKTMPELVRAYLELLAESASLRETTGLAVGEGNHCRCNKRVLKITVVRWTEIEDIVLRTCNCVGSTAPVLLLRGGLFPCSPLQPNPGRRSFCKTLESYLARRDYQLGSGERLRIRFGNALQWFTHVVNCRRTILLATPNLQTLPARKRCRPVVEEEDEPPANPFPEPPPRSSRPSDYLIDRCPPALQVSSTIPHKSSTLRSPWVPVSPRNAADVQVAMILHGNTLSASLLIALRLETWKPTLTGYAAPTRPPRSRM